jgi:hypothetical protein
MTCRVYTVKFSALTDMIARVEVEAETPEQAVELAKGEVEAAHFEIPEDGAEPIQDSYEAFAVEDDEGEEVLTLPQKSYSDVAAAITGADAEQLREVLGELLEWAAHTGGWDAPCWTRAKELFEAARESSSCVSFLPARRASA